MKTTITVYIGKSVNDYKIPLIKLACEQSIQKLCDVSREFDIQCNIVIDNDSNILGVLLTDKNEHETNYKQAIEMRA